MLRRGISVCLLVVVTWGNPVLAGPIPSPLQGVTISAAVTKDTGTGIFTYRYRVLNPVTNDGQVKSVDIEVTRGPADAVLSQDGLVNGPRYARHSSEAAFQEVPMVPVGLTAPEGWLSGLRIDRERPSYGSAGWGSMDEPFRILPGHTLQGFQLTSYGLPGIRATEILPDIDIENLPEEFDENPEAIRQLRQSLTFHTKTVAPKAPPATFVPIEFLNYLITLVHDSRQIGWITRDGAKTSLLAKLTNAKRKLEVGDAKVTKNILKAFLNEVEATSCQEFECPGNKPLTSEAYALLFFNGQFLWERL
jgi:hypothetical protein